MKKSLTAAFAIFCLLVTSGCWPLFFVAAGGTGAYAVSRDAIQGETDIPYESLWDSALMVGRFRGNILKQDFDKGSVEIMEGKAKVWITLERVTQSTTRLKVASRKYKLPNLELAQAIYTKVLDQAKPSEQ